MFQSKTVGKISGNKTEGISSKVPFKQHFIVKIQVQKIIIIYHKLLMRVIHLTESKWPNEHDQKIVNEC